MVDLMIAAILLLVLGTAIVYIVKVKKKGATCIGCPNSGSCSSCGGKCGDNISKDCNKE